MKNKKQVKLKVIKPINSPYGIFANTGDVIEYEQYGLITFKNCTMSYTLSEGNAKFNSLFDALKYHAWHIQEEIALRVFLAKRAVMTK